MLWIRELGDVSLVILTVVSGLMSQKHRTRHWRSGRLRSHWRSCNGLRNRRLHRRSSRRTVTYMRLRLWLRNHHRPLRYSRRSLHRNLRLNHRLLLRLHKLRSLRLRVKHLRLRYLRLSLRYLRNRLRRLLRLHLLLLRRLRYDRGRLLRLRHLQPLR